MPDRGRFRRALVVDSHDARAIPRAAWRTRLVRIAFAAVAVALLAAFYVSARDLDTRERGLLPKGTTGVVVLDLSLSISDDDYAGVRYALQRLVRDDARIGLVVFSDVAYELLPPGTPASELRPLMRLLRQPEVGPLVNPWANAFRAGTRVSSALALARDMLERDEIESPSILLVSDLETAPDDVPLLARSVAELRASGIELAVAGLNPSTDAEEIFAGLLADSPFVLPTDPDSERASSGATAYGLPRALLLLGALLFAALAVHERFGARLGLPPAPRRLRRAA